MVQELHENSLTLVLENLKRAGKIQQAIIKALKRGYFPSSETAAIQPGIDYLKGLGIQVQHAIKEQETKIKEAASAKPTVAETSVEATSE